MLISRQICGSCSDSPGEFGAKKCCKAEVLNFGKGTLLDVSRTRAVIVVIAVEYKAGNHAHDAADRFGDGQ